MKEFEADVISVSDDGRSVVLEATAFAPDAGGQPYDTGTINGVRVAAVHEKDGIITHELESGAEGAGLQAGMRVRGALDWNRRFDHMQNHLGCCIQNKDMSVSADRGDSANRWLLICLLLIMTEIQIPETFLRD